MFCEWAGGRAGRYYDGDGDGDGSDDVNDDIPSSCLCR